MSLVKAIPKPLARLISKFGTGGELRKMGVGTVPLRVGGRVMIEVDGELTYAVLYMEPYSMPFTPPMRVMASILRKATPDEAG